MASKQTKNRTIVWKFFACVRSVAGCRHSAECCAVQGAFFHCSVQWCYVQWCYVQNFLCSPGGLVSLFCSVVLCAECVVLSWGLVSLFCSVVLCVECVVLSWGVVLLFCAVVLCAECVMCRVCCVLCCPGGLFHGFVQWCYV